MAPRDSFDGTVSVILPTRKWTDACTELTEQVRPEHEFIIVCDRPDDPVVAAAEESSATVVVAGEPEGCSAKCNALAAGLERATGEYLVCTDADFEHGSQWLTTVLNHLAEAPPGNVVSSAPVAISEGLLMKPFEGPGAIGAVLTVAFDMTAWGGTMAFHRNSVDLNAYVADLRRTVSDDMLLTQRVDGVQSVGRLIRPMPVSGRLDETLARQVRWTRTFLYLDLGGLAFVVFVSMAVLVGVLLAPFVIIPLVTALAGLAYVYCGIQRWTFLFTVPAYIASLPLLAYGLAHKEFVWNGRRYRWSALYDVEVLDRDTE